MGKDDIQRRHHHTFAEIRQTDEAGAEFWYARDLQRELDYTEWRNFEKVINKALTACIKAGYDPNDHFVGVTKMVTLGSGAVREIEDIEHSRYACYLIVQNGDPTKPVIVHGQTQGLWVLNGEFMRMERRKGLKLLKHILYSELI